MPDTPAPTPDDPAPPPVGMEGHADSLAQTVVAHADSAAQTLDATIRVNAPSPRTGVQSSPRGWEPPSVEELQKMLPQYDVTNFIARGGMGAVYKGSQKALKRPVAIKVLPPEIEDGDLQFSERFKHEAQAMARLTHPNIVAVFDAGEVELGRAEGSPSVDEGGLGTARPTLLYFVMEFVEGTDVAQLIASEGLLEPQRAIDITVAVCEALAFAHEEGIVHRDIKPSNIMIDKRGRVKVADFGLAKSVNNLDVTLLTGTNMAMGTPDFIAPEAMIPGIKIDQRADLYAVGVMLYQMLTGKIPRGRFKLPSGVVPQIDQRFDPIVDKAMQTDREHRYSTAIEIKTDVEKVRTASVPQVSLNEGSADCLTATSGSPVRPLSQGGVAAKNHDAGRSARAPVKSRTPFLVGLIGGAAVIAISVFFALKKPHQSGPLSPLSGTSVPKASDPAQGTVRTTSPASVPVASAPAVTNTPLLAPPLPESGWKPLFTQAEWRASNDDYEFVEGLLHVKRPKFLPKPQPTADGAIRARIIYREGTRNTNVVARSTQADGHYVLGLGTDAKHVFLGYFKSLSSEGNILARHVLPRLLASGDVLSLELILQGDHLTGLVNGAPVIDAHDTHLTQPGRWGIYAAPGWFESVEVQPLPAAAAPAPVAAPALSESGWKTLIPPSEWRVDWSGETEYRGAKQKSSREYRDGLLHIRNTGLHNPQPSPDGAIRARIVIREGSTNIGVVMRNSSTLGRYKLGIGGGTNDSIVLTHNAAKSGDSIILARHDLAKPLQTGDKVLLELKVQGNRLTGSLNGTVVVEANDSRLSESGEWSLDATDGWIESVEVQPLPAAAVSGIKLWDAPDKLDNNPKAEWKDGAVHLIESTGLYARPLSRDAIIRASIRMNLDAGGPQVQLRHLGDAAYRLAINPKENYVVLARSYTDRQVNLMQWPLPRHYREDEWVRLELRAVGDQLTAVADGKELGTMSDSEFSQPGAAAIFATNGYFRDIEYVPLDASSISSSSPSLPVSKASDPKFPPGQWVRPFSGITDINDTWIKAGVTWTDGWITPGEGNNNSVTLSALNGRGKNWGVRARYRWQDKGAATLVLRRDGKAADNSQKSYQFKVDASGATFAHTQGNGTRPGSTINALGASSKVMLTTGSEVVIEAFTIGEKIYGRVNDQIFQTPTNGQLVEGAVEAASRQMGYRDIEFINLDGLSEAEALKLAGVDDKGHDLRKTAAPSPSLPVSKSISAPPPPTVSIPGLPDLPPLTIPPGEPGLVKEFDLGGGFVHGVKLLPDSRRMLVLRSNESLQLYDLEKQAAVWTVPTKGKQFHAVDVSQDGARFVTYGLEAPPGASPNTPASKTARITLRRTADGSVIQEWTVPASINGSNSDYVALSPSGKRLAARVKTTGGGAYQTTFIGLEEGKDQPVAEWDAPGHNGHTVLALDEDRFLSTGNGSPVMFRLSRPGTVEKALEDDVSFSGSLSPDRRWLIAHEGNSVDEAVWDLQSGKRLPFFERSRIRTLSRGFAGNDLAVILLESKNPADQHVCVWDRGSGDQIAEFATPKAGQFFRGGNSFATATNAQFCVTRIDWDKSLAGRTNTIQIWRLPQPGAKPKAAGNGLPVVKVPGLPELPPMNISPGEPGLVKRLAAGGKFLGDFRLLPDSRRLLMFQDKRTMLLDLERESPVWSVPSGNTPNATSISADGSRFVACERQGNDTKSTSYIVFLRRTSDGSIIRQWPVQIQVNAIQNALALSPTGKRVLVRLTNPDGPGTNAELVAFDADQPEPVAKWSLADYGIQATFGLDDDRFICGGFNAGLGVLDVRQPGTAFDKLTIRNFTKADLTPDQRWVAGQVDGKLLVWDMQQKKLSAPFDPAFEADQLQTAGNDLFLTIGGSKEPPAGKHLDIWDRAQGKRVLTFQPPAGLAFLGGLDGAANGTFGVVRLKPAAPGVPDDNSIEVYRLLDVDKKGNDLRKGISPSPPHPASLPFPTTASEARGMKAAAANALPPLPATIEARAVRLYDSEENIPPHPKYRWEDNALRVDDDSIRAPASVVLRDFVLRASVRMNPDARALRLVLRLHEGNEVELSRGTYQLTVSSKDIQLQSVRPNASKTVKSWKLARSYAPDDWLRLEVRLIGDEITVAVDGAVLGVVHDQSVSEKGRIALYALSRGYFRDIVYIPLDGLPEAELQKLSATTSPHPPISLTTATKDTPFINTLGMQFVPIPITGGPTDKQRVLFSVWETRVQDYEVFAKETKRDWPKPDFAQTPTHPAVNVSWEDATTFCAWLTERERKAGKLAANEHYRLPSDHEWSCAVGIGEKEDAMKLPGDKNGQLQVYPWGSAWPPPTGVGNFTGEEMQPDAAAKRYLWLKSPMAGYRDAFTRTSSVGSFPPDGAGLYDLNGNAREWCEDTFAPGVTAKVVRGGSWGLSDEFNLRSSCRNSRSPSSYEPSQGFRCVLEVAAPGAK